MKITSQIILAASLLCLASCTDTKKTESATTGIGTTPLNLPAQSSQAQPAANATAGVNPEHGQPGHRCDIPVGASLSTPVQANPTLPTSSTTPAPFPTTTTSSNTKVAPGMNPPHGEPGHDCAVEVGAPLNK